MKQESLFKQDDSNNIDKLWCGMPEYKNEKLPEPVVTVEFRFASVADYEDFKEIIKVALYYGVKPFDGMQKKEKKNSVVSTQTESVTICMC